MNIAHNLELSCYLFPNKPALIFEEQCLTYQDLDEMVNRAANGLRTLGIRRRDRIALFLPNIPEFVISYFAILKIGAVVVSINVMLKTDEVRYILNDCAAKAIITTESQTEYIKEADLPELQHILIAEGKAKNYISLTQLMAKSSPEARAVEMTRDAPASILYTSGTTGFPKGATLSHSNVIFNSYSANCGYRIQKSDRLLLFLPLSHCFGQNALLNTAISTCSTIILQRRFDPKETLKAITENQVTMLFGVPTVFIKLLNMDTDSYNLKNIRYYFSAAAPMPLQVAENWYKKYGIVINEGYGLTETSPFATYNHNLKYKLGSVGTPIANVEVKVVNGDGNQVEIGELGEIVIKGANVMLGYWNRPFETAEVIKKGWLHTGDIGWMDEDGFFFIVDRLKDMIVVSGFKVYPTEIENVIYQHPGVAEVAVYGVPDYLKGEIVKANIVLKAGHTITEQQIIDFCYEKMAAYKVPRVINFVNSIPKNSTGKMLKRVLRQESISQFAQKKTRVSK
ncbi:MAG: long-chain-fatty-acid--CoA ligase [Nostoc sp. ChiSLP01]|nr:long-chain fatty acid--CoA ligase [Nostoc sp. CmiSLP01]MDZ8286520.1 long-chain fatty acid--CoA ligase [Nostoc sp. ChiSLP01]